MRKDGRYQVRLEFCGYPEARYVVRFCGQWVGQRETETEARELSRVHYETRIRPFLQGAA